jgi:F-type H+-transporting ATPase subunit delta
MAELSTFARPYAKAAFEAAQQTNELAKWSELLQVLAALTQQEKVEQVLENPALTDARKVEILSELCQDQMTDAGRNFLTALSENKRLGLLPEVAEQFETLKAELEQSIEVQVTSAFPVSEAQINRLTQALKTKLNREIQVITTVDQSLVGGAVIRAGDMVIDGSVRGKLYKLAEAMNS